jgi:polyhydroxyalkanoate synthesis regulator protein
MRFESHHAGEQVLVKLYATRRLYRPDVMRYVTPRDLGGMARRGEAFRVTDAVTGDDVTPSFHPIIVEH